MTVIDTSTTDTAALATKVAPDEPPQNREWPNHLLLFTVGILVVSPVVIAIFTSFTPLNRILADPMSVFWPEWTLENYRTAWNATPFGRFLLNSAIQTGIITFAQVIFSVLAGYAFAMFEFRFKNVLFFLVIGSLMVPFELVFIPNFLLISDWGWANTYQGLTVPFLASAFGRIP